MKINNDLIIVFGDIHGCLDTFRTLFKKVAKYSNSYYSVGDLIDRGDFSREVVEFCIQNNVKPVRGNHEDMLLNAIDSYKNDRISIDYSLNHYFQNGGLATIKSYNNSENLFDIDTFIKNIEAENHLSWLRSLPLKIEIGKILISHAGITKNSDDYSILWNRDKPLKLNKLQIFGHTPVANVDYIKNHYANIDTGCVYRNKLSAAFADISSGSIIEIVQEDFHKSDKNKTY